MVIRALKGSVLLITIPKKVKTQQSKGSMFHVATMPMGLIRMKTMACRVILTACLVDLVFAHSAEDPTHHAPRQPGTGFHVSDASFNYEEAAKYCGGKSMTLASIYTAEELAEARAVIKAKGIDKAITSATADGIGWKWREKTEYWTHDKFPLNTGDVTDGADGNFQGMYSLWGDGDFVWDADDLHEKHPALCRVDRKHRGR